jgi:hypothetical protein
VITSLRGYIREEFFEADSSGDSTVGTDTVYMRVPTHKFWFTVGNDDWIEFEGLMYTVVMAKKMTGGTTVLLLHIK